MINWQWTIFTIFTTKIIPLSDQWQLCVVITMGCSIIKFHHVGHDLHIELPTPWQLPSHILYISCTSSTNTIKTQQIIVMFVYLLLTCMFCCHYLIVGYIDSQGLYYIIQIMWKVLTMGHNELDVIWKKVNNVLEVKWVFNSHLFGMGLMY